MKNQKPSLSILIPDGERRQLESVINCLSQVPGIRLFVMSNKRDNALRFSRYVHCYSYYPETSDEQKWMYYLKEELEKNKIDIILPVFEERIRTLIRFRNSLKDRHKLVFLPSLQSFDTANNKGLLAEHLKLQNIPGPRSITVEPNQYGGLNKSQLQFPLLAKPTEMTDSGIGIHLFKDIKELDQFFAEKAGDQQYILQDFIKGYDLGCNVLCKDGELLAYTIQKGNMWDNMPYSPQVGLDFIYDEEIMVIVKKLMKSLNWSGVANVDMLYDEDENRVTILEVNPRYWATLDASLVAGVNFPYLQCLSTLGTEFKIPSYQHKSYLTLNGLVMSIKQNKSFLFRFSFIWNNTSMSYIFRDPLPMGYRLFRRIRNFVIKKKNR